MKGLEDGKTSKHEEFRKAGYKAIDDIIAYYRTLESTPPADNSTLRVVAQVEPGYFKLPNLSTSGCGMDELMNEL